MATPGRKLELPKGGDRSAWLISLGLSFLIWFFLKLSKEYETYRVIELEYELPALMEFTEVPPSQLGATISGTGFDLAKLSVISRHPSVTIDIAAHARPEVQREELIRKIEERLSVNVLDIDRNYLLFSIDSTQIRKVPVRFNAKLSFARDFYMKDTVHLSADSVIISGAMNEIQPVAFLETKELVLNGINEDVQRTLDFELGAFQTLKTVPEQVELFIPVEQYTEKSFDIPVQVIHASDSVQILPSNVKLTCIVGLSRYDELKAADFKAVADLSDLVNPFHQTSIPVQLLESPPWIRSIRLSPKSVDYLIIQ